MWMLLHNGCVLLLLVSHHCLMVAGFTLNNEVRSNFHLYSTDAEDWDLNELASAAILLSADDDAEEIGCKPPTGIEEESKLATRHIFAVSDSTGVTAKSTIQKCLSQFGSCDDRYQASEECDVQTRSFTFIRGESAVASIVKKAEEINAFVLFTIADPVLREKTSRMCELSNVPALDLLGPSLNGLSDFLEKEPMGIPMVLPDRDKRKVALSDIYYRRIESVEFTLKADDGQAPWLLSEADVVLVGVSRTGKTPLSVILSQTMGFKVANIPLVYEVPAPKELFLPDIDPNRIFCLTIAPSELKRIRTARLERNVKQLAQYMDDDDMINKSKYNDRAYLMNDLKNARELAQKYNWTEIDVTGRAVEETASIISEMMNERFADAAIFNDCM